MARALLVLAAVSACACSPGPGRDPVFRDAAVVLDAAPADSGAFDAGDRRDAGVRDANVVLPDAGPPPSYPFTGIFGVFDSADPIFAREVNGRLNLIVGRMPYSYVGSITEAGEVDLVSPELTRGGCLEARILGSYGRSDTQLALQHRSCNAQGQAISSNLRGAFADDFDPRRSGIYRLEGQVVLNTPPCWTGNQAGNVVFYGVSFTGDGSVAVFAAHDVIDEPAVYVGRTTGPNGFAAIQIASAASGAPQFSLTGSLEQVSVNDPLVLRLERDVYDPVRGCAFRMVLVGQRVATL